MPLDSIVSISKTVIKRQSGKLKRQPGFGNASGAWKRKE
jgi:hypothetical protein